MSSMKNTAGAMLAGLLLSGNGAHADWVPSTGGTYDYGAAGNWSGGVINNVFLPSNYAGTAQTITIGSDAIWNTNATVVTAHTNACTLLLRAAGADRNLALGGGVTYVTAGADANNDDIVSLLQFGTVNANEKINFSLASVLPVRVDAMEYDDACVIFNGVLSGGGGVSKSGSGNLYLQNAASTFTGKLEVTGGLTTLAGAGATLATETIVVGRQDKPFGYGSAYAGTQGVLVMGNNTTPAGTSSGSLGANANRIPDTATVELQGGGLRLEAWNGDGNNLTETVGTVNLTRGQGDLVVWPAATGPNNVATLSVNNLNRSPGAVLGGYSSAALGTGAALEGRITFGSINGGAPSAAVVNGIIPWAVNGAQRGGYYWQGTAPGDFLTYGANGLTPQTSFVGDINAAGATDNVKISSTTATLSANKTINSLTVSKELYGTPTLILASGAVNVFVGSPAGGAMSIYPRLDFNGREGFIFVNNGMALNVYGGLTNTGGNGITITGYGVNYSRTRSTMTLYPGNAYTGPTTINGVYLNADHSYPPKDCLPTNTAVVINEGGALNTRGADTTIGSLAGVGIVDIDYDGAFYVGGDNTSTTFAGTLQEGPNGGVNGRVTKNGTGAWTLSGTNTYLGATTVAAGGLVVDGALAASTNAVTVQNGAFLGGRGRIARAVTVNTGAVLAAGLTNTVGTLNISSNLSLQSDAVLDVQIGGAAAYDQVVVGGAVNLNSGGGAGSTLRLSVSGTLRGGQQYTIIDNQSANPVQGAFANGATVSAGGYKFSIAYNGGDDNDVVLTVLPSGTVVTIR
jgi:autotransporter-associated beta strand protein